MIATASPDGTRPVSPLGGLDLAHPAEREDEQDDGDNVQVRD